MQNVIIGYTLKRMQAQICYAAYMVYIRRPIWSQNFKKCKHYV